MANSAWAGLLDLAVSSAAASHSEARVNQAILKENLTNESFFETYSMSNLHTHAESKHTFSSSTQEREKLQKHHWEHLFLLNKAPKKSLSIDLQNAHNIVICFLIFLFNSNLSVLICPKFDHQQKTTHILAANPKTDHEKTENKILFWSRSEKNCQNKYLEVKAE